MKRLLYILPVLFALTACAQAITTQGNFIEEARLEKLQVGKSNARDVTRILGTPTTKGAFRDNIWYYVGQMVQKQAFLTPKVLDRNIIAVYFNDQYVVRHIEQLTLDDAQQVKLINRKTKTGGHDVSIIRQLIGNVGRF